MSTKFEVGDKVRLTGEKWGEGGAPESGSIVTITSGHNDLPEFRDDKGLVWVVDSVAGWDAELVAHVDAEAFGDEPLADRELVKAAPVLPPNTIQVEVTITDGEGSPRRYAAVIQGLTTENYLEASFAASNMVSNTIEEHYAPRQLMREVQQ